MRTATIAALVSLFVLALGTSASAQSTWQYRGVTFTPRAGWCGAEGVDAGGVPSFVMKPCDQQWPQISTAPVFPAGSAPAQLGVEEITARLLAHANTPSEQARVAGIGQRVSAQCQMVSYIPGGSQIPGVRSVGTIATFHCPQVVTYNNITVMVRGRDGAIWGIAADFGATSMTPDDVAHVQSLVASIGQQ